MTEPLETGLIGGVEKRDISVVEYDPSWPERFHAHEKVIRQALGETTLTIEHVGSTAVPGLAAKPIIDILLVVSDPSKEELYLPQLLNAGYELRVREPDYYDHRMVRTLDKDVHIHVYPPTAPDVERYYLVRDELRQNEELRNKYGALKQKLASEEWSDMNAYSAAKTEVIDEIIAAAEARSS
ncbi:GrpB family protein [soil metagenome]